MIVADTNLLVYLLIDGPLTRHALQVRAKDRVWVVPTLLRDELLHVFSRHVARGQISRDEAIRHYNRAISMVDVAEWTLDPVVIFNLADRSKCSTYDIEYVQLAQELDVPLVTADTEILNAFPDIAVGIDVYATRSRR